MSRARSLYTFIFKRTWRFVLGRDWNFHISSLHWTNKRVLKEHIMDMISCQWWYNEYQRYCKRCQGWNKWNFLWAHGFICIFCIISINLYGANCTYLQQKLIKHTNTSVTDSGRHRRIWANFLTNWNLISLFNNLVFKPKP